MADAKNCVINVWNEQGWELDPAMLKAALEVAARHLPQSHTIDIYPQERVPADAPAYRHPGMCEWIVRPHYIHGGTLHIGLIQRTLDADIETHT